jgi:hypothetical protein
MPLSFYLSKHATQFLSFETCHYNSQDSSKNATRSLPKMPLKWHISKDENCSGISQIRNSCSGIYLINPFKFREDLVLLFYRLFSFKAVVSTIQLDRKRFFMYRVYDFNEVSATKTVLPSAYKVLDFSFYTT